MELRDLDVHDDARLREWWVVEQAAHRHDRDQPVLRTFDSLAFAVRNPSPHYRREPVAALVDGRVVGVADLGFPLLVGVAIPLCAFGGFCWGLLTWYFNERVFRALQSLK